MMIYFVILIIMTLIGSIASLYLKKASVANGFVEMMMNVNLFIGGGLYLISALLNIWILRFLDYSVVLPLTSFTYIWTMILSSMFLKEKITYKKITGIVFILIGAICVSI